MNIGLYTGTMGMLLPRLLEYKLDERLEKLKEISLLSSIVYENFGNLNSLDFKYGITGIGWALEWCAQHQLLKINSDEILADIDDLLYRDTVYTSCNKGSLFELVWRANYFYQRGISKNKYQNRYRHLCHRECLFLVLEDLEEMRTRSDNVKQMDDAEELHFLALYFLLLSKVFMLKDQAIESAFYDITQQIMDKLVLHLQKKNWQYKVPTLYVMMTLAEVFVVGSRNSRHYYWAQQGEELLHALKDKVDKLEFDTHNTLSDLTLNALHYINTKDERVREKLQNILGNIAYDAFPDTLYQGKGMIDIVRVLAKAPQYTTDMIDLLLL